MRRLKGIPALVSMLDHPNKDVHHSACGALKNISFGRDQDNKIAMKNCDGVPALVRLLRKTHDQDLTDTITGIYTVAIHFCYSVKINFDNKPLDSCDIMQFFISAFIILRFIQSFVLEGRATIQ